MRFTRYFAALITLFVVTSCVNNDIDILAPSASADSGAVTICGRITSFDDHAVTTRAGKTNEESYSSSMAMAIFPINENDKDDPTDDVLGDCISYIHLQGSNVNFTIDRKKLRETYGVVHDNKPFALYLFANMPKLPANMEGLADTLVTLESFMKLAYANSGIRRPQKGFPMVGSLGDYITEGADGKKFVLIPTTGAEPNVKISLPLVDNDPNDTNAGEPSDYIPIPLKALYAKFSFVITLEPDQHIQNGATPTFTLENYVLNNVPKSVCAGASLNDKNPVFSDEKITTPVGTSVTEGGELKFDFYLPERFLTPNTLPKNFPYPLGENYTPVEGYSNVRDEDKKYCQRFKPDLVTPEQKATYITLNGHYSDHQGHNWDVTYDIYLGEDNYGNFDFKRNTNYINSVVIRGIKANIGNGEVGPYIDHRVTVRGTLPIIISLQRETLLDSHFEVRPLRVRHPSGAPAGSKVTVEVLDELGNSISVPDGYPNWVRIEHRNPGAESGTHLPSGKRRYFTTDLVTNTLVNEVDGRLSTVTLTGNKQETFWIYVDQCDEGAPLSNPNQVRKAKIKVTYDKDGDPNTANEELVYTICQHLLYPVQTTRSVADVAGTSVTAGPYTYYIEYEEEYLHNFDSEDSYGVTEEAGMEWGLNGVQLSHKDEAIKVLATSSGLDFIAEYFGWDKQKIVNDAVKSLKPKPYYDFYMVRDVLPTTPITPYAYNGLQFNEEIAYFLRNDDTYKGHQGATSSKDAKIDGISLDEEPKSAFAYCYNRNKRNSSGNVVSQDWYLPAIDEIEDIMEFAYGDFDDEFQGNMYWSCQPAYYKYESSWQVESFLGGKNTAPGVYYTDNTNRARASKALRIDDAFAGVPDSGDGRYATQSGSIYVSLIGNTTIKMDSPVLDLSHDSEYKNYPGNLSRTGTKARVRCIRKAEGVTVH